ncbi:hypothetical protein Naga_102248g1 [Nannochloropsis gaditana]|uniref:Uncharacterized protein n=1 Tax=Nannochloropsis gaditana TaxID=72520 RepID=W7TQL3_9STRA|nr:hypothetical protein Naga_102248g1 [Nannochloropsis gaditana]
MVVTSDFYVAITGRDTSLYLHTLWLSLLIVLAVVVCKTFKTLSVELLALQCHRPTLPGTSSETSLPPSLPPSAPVDNPDQRLTSDLEIFGAKLAELIGQTLAVPALVLYCE